MNTPVLLQNVELPGWIVLATFDPDAPDEYRWQNMVSLTPSPKIYPIGALVGYSKAKYWREWDGEITLTMSNGAARSNVQ